MKNIGVLIVVVFSIMACSDDDNANSADFELLGTWKLIEIYSGPDDGSGDFVAKNSEKTIQFNADGTLSSNANLCDIFSGPLESSAGTYSEIEATISIIGCQSSSTFEIVGANLIVSYSCIEFCQEKYVKL